MNSSKSSEVLLQTKDITRVFKQGGESLTVLNNVEVQIKSGEMVALVGPSGSGKSTFLQTVGLLDRPTSGQLIINGEDIAKASDEKRTQMRRDYLGFVYQFHYLLPEFSALENVVIPQMIAGVKRKDAMVQAEEMLTKLGLSHRLSHRPATLSGGEQQRVAIARALANKPMLLLADEPTGNLDPETSESVFEILIDLVKQQGIGAIIATHNMQIAERMTRIMEIKNGRVISY
ncbi:MAG: ABC transporter ATP-binding protein [Alphaproteobacteria bacterium]|nr:ABC transporter ATP-binding protein [Alphaproteobacteria bacterium]NCQ88080.1 ABC transporter ATP-binding protein [Alphaproteobacteria bacterium]NCT05413.1 ABC transporter ATP-binding protein [Alphaproteobacteria bacterium]